MVLARKPELPCSFSPVYMNFAKIVCKRTDGEAVEGTIIKFPKEGTKEVHVKVNIGL